MTARAADNTRGNAADSIAGSVENNKIFTRIFG